MTDCPTHTHTHTHTHAHTHTECTVRNKYLNLVSLTYGLVVRIPGFHPGCPGSNPSAGTRSDLWVSLMAQMVNSPPANAGDPGLIPG